MLGHGCEPISPSVHSFQSPPDFSAPLRSLYTEYLYKNNTGRQLKAGQSVEKEYRIQNTEVSQALDSDS